MEPMKNLCGLIPESLHKRLMENKDPEMTNGEYLTKVLTAYLDQPATPRQEQRTLAVQISEEMFQQLKSYLDAHSPLTQKAFVQSLLNQALGQWEQGDGAAPGCGHTGQQERTDAGNHHARDAFPTR